MPGETSTQAVARFFNTRIDPPELRDRAELVVMSFGTNDVITQTTAEQSFASLRSALDLAGQLSLPAFVVGPPPVGDLPEADAKLVELSSEFAAICAQREVPFAETHGPLAAGGAWAEEAAAGDGSHPQGGGYDQLTRLLDEAGLVAWLSEVSR